MISWVIIGVFVIIALIILQFEHHSRKIKFLIFAILGIALYFSLVSVINSNEADLGSPRGIISTIYSYFGWIGETGAKLWDIGKETTMMVGNVIKLNITEEGVVAGK
jgi:hypothetical protein